jgi:hypothetical protein
MENISTPIATAQILLTLNTSNFKPALQKALNSPELNKPKNVTINPMIDDIKLRQNALRVQNQYMKVAGEVRNAFAGVGAVGIGLGKSAITSFLKTDSVEATNLRLKIAKLGDAWAGVGGKLNQASIGGKTLSQWIDKLASGLNGLSVEKIERIAKAIAFSAAIAGGIQFLRVLEGIKDTFERIGILKDRATVIRDRTLSRAAGNVVGNTLSDFASKAAPSFTGSAVGSAASSATTARIFEVLNRSSSDLNKAATDLNNVTAGLIRGGGKQALLTGGAIGTMEMINRGSGKTTTVSINPSNLPAIEKMFGKTIDEKYGKGTFRGALNASMNGHPIQASLIGSPPRIPFNDGMNKALSNIVPTLNTFRSKIAEVSSSLLGFASKLGSVLMNIGGIALAGYGGVQAGLAIRKMGSESGESYGERLDRAVQGDSTSMAANILSKTSIGGFFLSGLIKNKDAMTLKNPNAPNKETVINDLREKEAINLSQEANDAFRAYESNNKRGNSPYISAPDLQKIRNAIKSVDERKARTKVNSNEYNFWNKEGLGLEEKLKKIYETLYERTFKNLDEDNRYTKSREIEREVTGTPESMRNLAVLSNRNSINQKDVKDALEDAKVNLSKLERYTPEYNMQLENRNKLQDAYNSLLEEQGKITNNVLKLEKDWFEVGKQRQLKSMERAQLENDIKIEEKKAKKDLGEKITDITGNNKPLSKFAQAIKDQLKEAMKVGDIQKINDIGELADRDTLTSIINKKQGTFSSMGATELPNFISNLINNAPDKTIQMADVLRANQDRLSDLHDPDSATNRKIAKLKEEENIQYLSGIEQNTLEMNTAIHALNKSVQELLKNP